MPYVTVPKDFANVKKKVVLGLSKRQLLAAAAGLGICLPAYFFLKPHIGDKALYLITLIATPIFLLGFYKGKDGRLPEKIFFNYIRVRYRLPRTRPYRAENIYAYFELAKQIQEVIDNANAEAENKGGKKAGPLRRFAQRCKKKDHKAD